MGLAWIAKNRAVESSGRGVKLSDVPTPDTVGSANDAPTLLLKREIEKSSARERTEHEIAHLQIPRLCILVCGLGSDLLTASPPPAPPRQRTSYAAHPLALVPEQLKLIAVSVEVSRV